MSSIFKSFMLLLYLIIGGLTSLSARFMWPDIPPWGQIGLGGVIMVALIYAHEFLMRMKPHQTIADSLKQLSQTQQEIMSKVEDMQSRYIPLIAEENNEQDPQAVSKTVLSEIQFMRTLMHQIADYHEKILAQQPVENPSSSASLNPDPVIIEAEGVKPLNRSDLLEALQSAVKSDRIEMLLQPIVSLPQRKRRHCECFSRIKDAEGNIIIPDNYIKIAQDESLISIIDNTLIFRCIQLLKKVLKKSLDMNFFCNISTHSLKNDKFSEGLIEFFIQNPRLSRYIIFEIDYYALEKDKEAVSSTIQTLARHNCSFSLDKVEDVGKINVADLKKNNFKFIKIEAQSLIKTLSAPAGEARIRAFKEKTDKAEIDIILTKVEEENQLIELLDLNFDFGQGYLFGAPKLSSY